MSPLFTPGLGRTLLAIAYSALWVLALVAICLPLWLIGMALIKAGHLLLLVGYTVRRALEYLGNKLET